jgi:hypothetical protein
LNYVVYCDESRHNGPENHRYMAIGGLWVVEERKTSISQNFKELCKSRGLNAEVKWNKVSSSRLADYELLVDFFFQTSDLYYRVIVVDQTKVNAVRFHAGDHEVGFYKFYYQMLKSWVLWGNQYRILLDFKRNRVVHRYSDLEQILRRRAVSAHATISNLLCIDSYQTPLAQLCDVLTGAVAAACCRDTRFAKATLANYIAKRASFPDLRVRSLSPAFSKFNIFRINLG